MPPKPPAGAGPVLGSASPGLAGAGREVAAPGSGGCARGNHSRHLVLIPCHTLTPLVNSLLLLWSSRVSLFPVPFSVWLGYGPRPSTLTPGSKTNLIQVPARVLSSLPKKQNSFLSWPQTYYFSASSLKQQKGSKFFLDRKNPSFFWKNSLIPSGRHPLCKHEVWGGQKRWCMSVTPGHWSVSLAKTTSSRTNDKCCLNKPRRRTTGNYVMWSSALQGCMHTCAYKHTHTRKLI